MYICSSPETTICLYLNCGPFVTVIASLIKHHNLFMRCTLSLQQPFVSIHRGTCIYAPKEIVENHRSLDGSMFMGFLDASKAFDRLYISSEVD